MSSAQLTVFRHGDIYKSGNFDILNEAGKKFSDNISAYVNKKSSIEPHVFYSIIGQDNATGIKRCYETVSKINSNAFYEMKDIGTTLNRIKDIVSTSKEKKLNFILCLSLTSIRDSVSVVQNNFPVNSIFYEFSHDIHNPALSNQLYGAVEILELENSDFSSLKVISKGSINDAGELVSCKESGLDLALQDKFALASDI